MKAETVKDDPPNPNEDSTELADAASALAAVTAERDQLAAEKAEIHDRYLRGQAEFQNLRRRIEKEKAEWHERAATEAVRTLIPILDDFERALKVGGAKTEYGRGMELIFQRLFDALKKLGLEPIDSQGQPFDPHIHDAVAKQETEDVSGDTVLEEFERGYNFKGQLLRPAKVRVAVAPVSKTE